MTAKFRELKEKYQTAGQGHIFRFAEELSESSLRNLIDQAEEIDLLEIERLNRELVSGGAHVLDLEGLEPAPFIPHPACGGDDALWQSAREAGEEALRAGKVAAFTVAGGQGTRLGFNGPKGTFPVTPIREATLFQVFAEKIRAASLRYRKSIPWLIMTSHVNHQATVAAFEEQNYFGLNRDDVIFFRQGRMPAVDAEGKILLEEKDRIAMSPDGHGGSLRALVRSGALARLKKRGIDTISYFQVDNPLVHAIDPAFIGFHRQKKSEMSSKMIPKAYATEKVGHFCKQGGRMVVVEYSDMPEALQEETLADGKLRFIAGSIAIHVLSVAFVERLGDPHSTDSLPFHRADKKIPCIDGSGQPVRPTKPNGIKFEMFVFDALPFAGNPVVIETRREDEFSPVKNAEGLDSVKTCRDDQLRQFSRWALAAGVDLPVDVSGLPPFSFEVSPLFADSESAFVEKWNSLPVKPKIEAGTVLLG